MVKPLIVGEANPYGTDPRYALYPEPRGASGDRLCRLVMGLTASQYLAAFDRVNLCPSSWSIGVARSRAAQLRARTGPLVLLGAKVCSAFGVEFLPFTWEGGVAVLPHPSGLSRLWNEPASYERARAVLRACGALA